MPMSDASRRRVSHGGLVLPPIGFGTYALRGAEGERAVTEAIEAGYTLIDSAVNYENEGVVGRAVRAAARPREELIVTSKLPGRHHERAAAISTIEESLARTGLDYLDLYLVHWPNPRTGCYVEAWQALVEARERGLVRAIGVSNFLPEHLERLERETGVLPEVNQIELHPFFPQREQLAVHERLGVLTQAWSPLARGMELLSQPVLAKIAAAHGATPAQIVLAWHIGRGVIPIPKAATAARRTENLAAAGLRLDEAERSAITALGRPDGRRKGQHPADYEEF